MVADSGGRVRGEVVHELGGSGHGGCGGLCLGGRQRAEGYEDGAVDGSAIIEINSDDLLESLCGSGIDRKPRSGSGVICGVLPYFGVAHTWGEC
jgi:hypothetical protein